MNRFSPHRSPLAVGEWQEQASSGVIRPNTASKRMRVLTAPSDSQHHGVAASPIRRAETDLCSPVCLSNQPSLAPTMHRRGHRKSRNGCIECKRRHMKVRRNKLELRLATLCDNEIELSRQVQDAVLLTLHISVVRRVQAKMCQLHDRSSNM